MKVVFDIEANALENPDKIWLVVCKCIDSGEYHLFRRLTDDRDEANRFQTFSQSVDLWVGHNCLSYDLRVLCSFPSLLERCPGSHQVVDTLVISKLMDFSRPDGHSIESYGLEFNKPKIEWNDWSKYDESMVEYCKRDVDICHEIYLKYQRQLADKAWQRSIRCEHEFQRVVDDLHDNGFAFDSSKAHLLLKKVEKELEELDGALSQIPDRKILVREYVPKSTKFGTINRSSVPRAHWDRIHELTIGNAYRLERTERFNPDSPKQIIDILREAGWRPTEKTKGHLEALRNCYAIKDLLEHKKKLDKFEKYGYKINEANLSTLPSTAPTAAKTIAKRILYEARRRTLTEWLSLVDLEGRIHGQFQGIGAWTHRMSHQKPNMANIPNSHDINGNIKLLGGDMRSLFIAPPGRLLVGVDAEGIQLRIFAHYIDDEEFTDALVRGKKEDKTDPHSLNQRVLGSSCRSRAAAKRFIYAMLLGAGMGKLSEILGCSKEETQEALDRLLARYTGFAKLKKTIVPTDARRGYFEGIDGRRVPIPGDSERDRSHLALSGYLQNGEAVCMKYATLSVLPQLPPDCFLVDLVHDEWQTEVPDDMPLAMQVAEMYCTALREVGEKFKLKCPLAGSYMNDGVVTIGKNWKVTH